MSIRIKVDVELSQIPEILLDVIDIVAMDPSKPRGRAKKISTIRNKVLRNAARKALLHWWREFLPRHFTHQASSLYAYAPRDPNYVRRKGNKPPLVKKGIFRKVVRQGGPKPRVRIDRITGSVKAKISVPVPNYTRQNRRWRRLHGHNLSSEVVMRNPSEDAVLERIIRETVSEEIFGNRQSLKRTVWSNRISRAA